MALPYFISAQIKASGLVTPFIFFHKLSPSREKHM
jgi:hypothetical protein